VKYGEQEVNAMCMGNRMIADNKEMARTNAERIY